MSKKSESQRSQRLTIIEAGGAEKKYWSDLWAYRELFAILAWRDIAVQYKQTVIGIAWAVARPLATMVIFTVIFGQLAKLPTEGQAPYSLMVMSGMLPWFLFSTILTRSSESLVSNSNLVSKVYFPRIIVPTASAVVALVDFVITIAILVVMMFALRFFPDWRILFLPIFALLAVLAALGPAYILASLNVKYRDFRIILPFLVQFGVYVTPVGFSSSVVPEQWRFLYSINPVVGVIDGFRWCILAGQSDIYWPGMCASVLSLALMMVLGIIVFRSTEKSFADVI